MLKQILATSAVIAIATVSVQPASAASDEFRQLVVEPAGDGGRSASQEEEEAPAARRQPGQGIPTPAATPGRPAATRCSSSSPRAAASRPRRMAVATATARASRWPSSSSRPAGGIHTAGGGAGAGSAAARPRQIRQQVRPVHPEAVARHRRWRAPTPASRQRRRLFPAIAGPSGLYKPVGADSTGPGADATPLARPALEPQPAVDRPAGDAPTMAPPPRPRRPAASRPCRPRKTSTGCSSPTAMASRS